MATPKSPPGSVRRHGRNVSHPMVRRTTRGPLDATDDPLAEPTKPSSPATSSLESSQVIASTEIEQPPIQPIPDLVSTVRPSIVLDFLQRRDIYHKLSSEDIPSAFLNSENRPPPDADLSQLIQFGHFRRAAELALRALIQCPPDKVEQILSLLYTRLACLILISRPDIAAEEALPLTDFLVRGAPGVEDIVPLIPWELRLLLVRLQSIGASDGGRRGIMALYALAGEVRANLRRSRADGDEEATKKWSFRLRDLGLRVCDALVEMGELETAQRHLDTLLDVDPDETLYRKALLRIRVGDATGARHCAQKLSSKTRKDEFEALLQMADGDYQSALTSWQSFMDEYPSHELFAHNAAVAMLYTGQITSARDLLEDLSQRLPMFPTLLFNLSTIYELCSERAVEQKTALAQTAAAKIPAPESGGWEKMTLDFKL